MRKKKTYLNKASSWEISLSSCWISCFVVYRLHRHRLCRRRQADCDHVKAKILTLFYIIIIKKPPQEHNARISQANSLSYQLSHEYSSLNYGKECPKAEKLQGKDGFGNGVSGVGGGTWWRRGIFGRIGHVDAHYLHNVYTMHILLTFVAHSWHV